jgi:hypothetical protein
MEASLVKFQADTAPSLQCVTRAQPAAIRKYKPARASLPAHTLTMDYLLM